MGRDAPYRHVPVPALDEQTPRGVENGTAHFVFAFFAVFTFFAVFAFLDGFNPEPLYHVALFVVSESGALAAGQAKSVDGERLLRV